MLLPHESTVAHEQRFIMDEPMISRTRSRAGGLGAAVTSEAVSSKLSELKEMQVRSVSMIFSFFFFYKS